MATPRYVWRQLNNQTITGNVAYSAMSSRFTLAEFFDQFVLDVAELTGSNTPSITVYGQRLSDNQWVPLAPVVTLVAGDAGSTYVVDIPPGIYDNVSYKISGNSGTGIDVAFSARGDSEAA